jgi:flagellar hook-length control protein FliK
MQAALKFFDFPLNSAGGQGANKIGIKLPERISDHLSGDENGFMEIMAALTRIPPQELNTSLAQLDWVPVEDSAGEFAPLIDLTDQASAKSSILQMLLPQQGTDTQAPPLPSQTPVGQAEIPIDPGKNTRVMAMIKPPTDAAVEQRSSATDTQHQQAQDGPARAVPTQVMPPNGTPESVLASMVSRNADGTKTVGNIEAADQKAILPTRESAGLVLSDRASETAAQTVGQSTDKTDTASLPSDTQPLRSNTLKQWLGNQAAPDRGKQLSGESLGRQAVSDNTNSAAQTFPAERSEHPALQERIAQNDRFVSTLSDRPAAFSQKVSGENVAVAQEAGLQSGEPGKQQPLNRAVRIDASPAMRKEVFTVKPAEGVEMQLSSNASREGAPSFDSQVSTTAPKTVEASSAANETMPFRDNDTQTDVIRQIVQRMTLRGERQQSQMVIRLKPDFLGNVRLQVTTEGQQVMVRMDAESAMVKEIVEQNMAHLKAELSQHGLEIEKFDVFVGNDNDGWRSGQQQAGFRQTSKRNGQPSNGAQSDDESSSDHSGESDNHGSNTGTTGTNEVDYFV